MLLKQKNINLICTSLVILTITSCGRNFNFPKNMMSFSGSNFLVAKNTNFPAPESVPQEKYTAISSVFPNSADITHGENLENIAAKLRTVSSLTKDYHQELLTVLRSTNDIDFNHLIVLVDSIYFPTETFNQMHDVLINPSFCANLIVDVCQSKIAQVKLNIKSAIDFGDFINTILIEGQSKLGPISSDEVLVLLSKSFASIDSTETLFKLTLKSQTNLTSEEKTNFIKLAVEKNALKSAGDLSFDYFKADTDKTFEDIIAIANKLPMSTERDSFLLNATKEISTLTGVQAKQLTTLALNTLNVAQATLAKISEPTAHDVSELATICKNQDDKEVLISLGITKLKTSSSLNAIELIRQSTKNKLGTTQALINLIPNLKANDLVLIASTAAYEQDREQIILTNLNRFSKLNTDEARLIADQSTKNTLQVVSALIPKIEKLTTTELAHLVEAINLGTSRDEALKLGLKDIKTSDVNGDIAILRVAYNTKVEVTLKLLAITPNLNSTDLALIAKECITAPLRDQILFKGAYFLTDANVEGAIAMVGLATTEKVNVALLSVYKIPNASAKDLGFLLKSVGDGAIRDVIITNGLKLIRQFDGDGAAMIVDRSYETKLATATALLKLIPNASGTDLDKMLAVCGSGNTRDQILVNGIALLGKLTKEEAKSIYTRAYNNKEKTAILLMSKVDNFDGQIVGELARLSAKGSTRDLIIAEGLKRLKTLDAIGLISMIKAADKITEKLALEVSLRLVNLNVDDAVAIAKAIPTANLRDRFLVLAIDLVVKLDEPMITQLALVATSQESRQVIVTKGVEKIGDAL